MKVVGIVGGMGAGKSTVVALMGQIRPVSFISADEVGHEILRKGHEAYEPVVSCFGQDILDDQGEIVRRRLGEKVFGNAKRLEQLNGITHPIITQVIQKKIAEYQKTAPGSLVILEAALLLESGLVDLTDCVIAVYADPAVRLKRVVLREGLEEQQILERFKAQKDWEELKAAADYVIDNSVSLEETKKQLEKLMAVLVGEEE